MLEGKGQEFEKEVDGVDPWDFFQLPQWRIIGCSVKQSGGGEDQNISVPLAKKVFHSSTVQVACSKLSIPKIRMCSCLLEVLLPNDN
jgi:hypothetical protein